MKKILVLLSCILLSALSFAQQPNALILKLTDGSTNTFILSEKPVVTLPDNNIVISGTANTMYARSDVEKFFFEYVDPTGVEKVKENDVTFKYQDGEHVRLSGLKSGTIVSVSSLDGKNLSTQKSDTSGNITVSLKNLPKGVYIISYDKRSVKVRK